MTTMTTTERPSPPSASGRRAPRFANRLLWWLLPLLLLSALGSLLILRPLSSLETEREIEAALDQEVEELRQLSGGNDPDTGEPFGTDVRRVFEVFLQRTVVAEDEQIITFLDGELHARSQGEPPARLDLDPAAVAAWRDLTAPERGRLDSAAGRVEYVAVPVQGGDTTGLLVVAVFADVSRAAADRAFLTAGAVQLGVGVLLAGAVVIWVARQLTRPLTRMAATAATITDTATSARFEVPQDRELQLLATAFNGTLDRLEAALDAQRRFLADVSHELRTPITIVQGHLDLLDDDPDERARTLELVHDELDRMGRIVRDLHLLARAEQPDFVTPGAVELDRLGDRIRRTVEPIADRDWRVDASGCPSVVVDEQRLVQAVVALADNAARHTPTAGRITVALRCRADELLVQVADTGEGIPADALPRVFDRFAHFGERRGGAGLGLSIVQRIAAAHGGRVTVDSAPGMGATFTLHLPQPGAVPP